MSVGVTGRGDDHILLVSRSLAFTEKTRVILWVTKLSVFKKLKGLLIGILGGEVQLGSFCTAATNRPIVPAPGDYDDGETGRMIGRGN
jgi:hypothetical protein